MTNPQTGNNRKITYQIKRSMQTTIKYEDVQKKNRKLADAYLELTFSTSTLSPTTMSLRDIKAWSISDDFIPRFKAIKHEIFPCEVFLVEVNQSLCIVTCQKLRNSLL